MPTESGQLVSRLEIVKYLLANMQRSRPTSSSNVVDIALEIGKAFHVAYLLAHYHLENAADSLPTSIQGLLPDEDDGVDTERDALTLATDCISLPGLLDLLSSPELDCRAPYLHRGWQDKTESCRTARRVLERETGFLLTGEERATLLSALAAYNRVFVSPIAARLSVKTLLPFYKAVVVFIRRTVPRDLRTAFSPLIDDLITS